MKVNLEARMEVFNIALHDRAYLFRNHAHLYRIQSSTYLNIYNNTWFSCDIQLFYVSFIESRFFRKNAG